MWRVAGRSVDTGLFMPFEPLEVLYDFDGPRTFTHRDREGELYLAHWVDEDEQVTRFIVVPFTPTFVERLKNGDLTLREALDQPRAWILDKAHTGEVRAAWRIQLADLPENVLPHPGTMLLPTLEPL